MPSPNVNNRLQFKQYLRSNREKFTSGVQTCILGDIQDSILTISSGIDTSQITRVILFDDNEVVGLSTILTQQQLFYVPALPDESIIIGIGTDLDNQYRLDFIGDGQGIKFGDQIFGINDVIGLGTDTSLTVKGLGGGLFQPGNPPTYSVGTSSTAVSEGGYVSVTVNTTNVGSGTTLFYNIIGNVDNADFSDNITTGSFVVSNGIGTVTKNIANDLDVNEGTEGFAIRISTGSTIGSVVGTSSTIFITDLGLPSYTITPSAASVNEGSSVSFTVNTVNVGTPSTLYYSTGGTVSAADFSNNSLSGSFSLVSTGSTTGISTFVRSIATDFNTESGEVFNIVIRTGSVSGTAVTTSSNVIIGDVTPTVNIAESATTVDEGGSVTFTISGSNIPNGTYYYTIYEEEGTVASVDFNPANLNGSFSISNNGGSLTITLAEDLTSEGTDKFKVQIRTGSISGTIIAESSVVTVGDTSKGVGSTTNGKTFGPVQVNRDSGSVANASDWYTIANLDQIPDGSSIALFIDGSGSMTQGTVQASYDKLLAKLNARGITITTVTNSDEDWITPFLVDLP